MYFLLLLADLNALNNEIGRHFMMDDGGREGFHTRRLQQQNTVEITEVRAIEVATFI